MISYDEALALTLGMVRVTEPERRTLSEAAGRVLAEDILAPFGMPRFTNSAVDGYALGEVGERTRYRVVRTIAAGDAAGGALAPDECARIFTGAPTPPNAAAVVMQELTRVGGDDVLLCERAKPGDHIRIAGEELREGAVAVAKGTRLNAAGVGVAATFGMTSLSVHSAVRVGILVTGSELVQPGSELEAGQIYESNSATLVALLAGLGIDAEFVAVVADQGDETRLAIGDALERCDVLIVTGGVSVGERDVVRQALSELAVTQVFWRVAVKPGKPVYAGQRGDQVVFGLPGNPLSVIATFTLFVEPFLKGCMGHAQAESPRLRARLTADIGHKVGRREFVPAVLSLAGDGAVVSPVIGQGSHMLSGLARSNAFVDVPSEAERLGAGDVVWVIPFGGLGC